MPQPNYGYLDPYSSEAEEIARRRRYADALREQSGTPIQPYSVGGMTAPISWTQGAAKLLQGYNAGAAGREADERAKALRERVHGDRSADMSALAAALRGRPAIPAPADELGGGPGAPAQPAGQLDPSVMGQLKSPDMQNLAMQMFAKQMQPKAPIKLGPGDQLRDPTDYRVLAGAEPKPEPPHTRTIQRGDQKVAQEFDPKTRTWSDIPGASGPAFAKMVGPTIVNPPAPTMTEVQDPTDSTRMLRVDAKAYRGGGLGSPGVLGISGKEPGAAKRDEKEAQGKELLSSELDNLRTHFKTLLDKGAITSDKEGGLSNAQAWVRNTGVGQLGGRVLGTQEQSARNEIQSARLRLLNAIKTATGMSAQQLNSNAELKTWLDSMTNLQGSYESNMGIVDAIEKAFMTPKRRASDKEPKPKVVDW